MTDPTLPATPVDAVIHARWVLPMTDQPGGMAAAPWLDRHAVVVNGGRVLAVVPEDDAGCYAPRKTYRLDRHALMPGLVNLHTHAAMTLLRGLADDLELMDWLKGHVWRAEQRHVSESFVRDGTLLACAEMIKAGVTCFNDMYFFPGAAAEAAVQAGLRAVLGLVVVDLPTAYARDAHEYLEKGLELRDRWRDSALLSFCMAPHAPYTVSDATFEKIAVLTDQLDLVLHLHLHETEAEIRQSLADHRLRPLARMLELGLVNANLLAVHAVHLTPGEIELLAARGCGVAHCPASNLKLASGIAPLTELLASGVRVGLGTDGAASNNRLDVFAEMRLAALLAKGTSCNPQAVPAATALCMATREGATALGLDASVGRIEPGWAADLTAVELGHVETLPEYDPLSALVYAAGREHVSHVWVNGRALLEDYALTTLDEAELRAKARSWRWKIAGDRPVLPHPD